MLQKGYWYGTNLIGEPIATSTWCVGENVYIYTRRKGKWKGAWVDINCPLFPKDFSHMLCANLENYVIKRNGD